MQGSDRACPMGKCRWWPVRWEDAGWAYVAVIARFQTASVADLSLVINASVRSAMRSAGSRRFAMVQADTRPFVASLSAARGSPDARGVEQHQVVLGDADKAVAQGVELKLRTAALADPRTKFNEHVPRSRCPRALAPPLSCAATAGAWDVSDEPLSLRLILSGRAGVVATGIGVSSRPRRAVRTVAARRARRRDQTP